VNEGILDSFGHVSVRSADNPGIFIMPCAMPPSLVTSDDLLALNAADGQPIDAKGRRVKEMGRGRLVDPGRSSRGDNRQRASRPRHHFRTGAVSRSV
jgi:hypothetical protein